MSEPKKPRKVTLEHLQELSDDERNALLYFMLGYGANSPKFQEILTAAYAEAMRARVRRAERDPEGLALVKAIHDRKQASE